MPYVPIIAHKYPSYFGFPLIFYFWTAHLVQESRPPSTKEEPASTSKLGAAAGSVPPGGAAAAQSGAPVTEDEIRAALVVMSPVTTQDLVAKFKPRLRSSEVVLGQNPRLFIPFISQRCFPICRRIIDVDL